MAFSFSGTPVAASFDRFDCAFAASASPCYCSASSDLNVSRSFYWETPASVVKPVVKALLTNVREKVVLTSTPSFSHEWPNQPQSWYPSKNHVFRSTEVTPRSNSLALIDIEDDDDGSVTFKFGTVEDSWHLDRLLEHLYTGAFYSQPVESFIPLVVELYGIPVSNAGQRKIGELPSSYIRQEFGVNSRENQKEIIEILAEAVSDFLLPTNASKYSEEPCHGFSSRLDKWWKFSDYYLDVCEGDLDFLQWSPLPSSGVEKEKAEYKEWSKAASADPLKLSQNVDTRTRTTHSGSNGNPSNMSWVTEAPRRPPIEALRTSDFALVQDNDLSSGVGTIEYIEGVGFILFSSHLNIPEDVFQTFDLEEKAARFANDFIPFKNIDTLPILSIQDMVRWEQEETWAPLEVSLPTKQVADKRTKPRAKTKTNHQFRGNPSISKSASKKRSTSERRDESSVYDIFFRLPIAHKNSGVAKFLVLQRSHVKEMSAVLNQVAVGLAGAALAATLQVVARMLSVNPTFDTSKFVGVIRAVGLLWLSAAMQSLRKVMLRLPTGCTTSSAKNKQQLLCLQQKLRSLSFQTLTVMVLMVAT